MAASRMPKGAKVGGGRAVHAGWVWQLEAARNWKGQRARGKQYVPVCEARPA